MTTDQFVAIIGALAVLVGAIGKLVVDLRSYHALVNSRMDELLALTRSSSIAEGRKLESDRD